MNHPTGTSGQALPPLTALVVVSVGLTGCFGPWRPLGENTWLPAWREPVASPRAYRAIALHASGSERGNAASVEEASPDRIQHHFVIGNGTASGNGQIEIGPLWKEQAPSALDGTETIDICLIGTFVAEAPFTQTASALNLLVHLTAVYRIPDEAIRFSPPLTEGSIDPEEFVRLLDGARLDDPRLFERAAPVEPDPFGLP